MYYQFEGLLDATGWQILEALQEDARISFTELGKRVGQTISDRFQLTVSERLLVADHGGSVGEPQGVLRQHEGQVQHGEDSPGRWRKRSWSVRRKPKGG